MNVRVNKVFVKELAKLPAKERLKVEKLVFEEVESYDSTAEIPNLKKLKGYRNYYKIRFGDYRAGLKLENNILYFERILHRKDIYKFYP
jgi:mRNA interferase RelE/StbE